MDKSILIEYVDMKEEIKDLRRRIAEDEKELNKLENMVVSDSVTCGKKGKKPLRTVKIKGRPVMAISRKGELLQQRIIKLRALEVELLELTNQVEEYITDIKDSRMRRIFRYRYIDNLTWVQVACRMAGNHTDESCRKAHDRYLGLAK
ncbi:MAG: hypothetical protein QM793_06700 [Muricomes sp.]